MKKKPTRKMLPLSRLRVEKVMPLSKRKQPVLVTPEIIADVLNGMKAGGVFKKLAVQHGVDTQRLTRMIFKATGKTVKELKEEAKEEAARIRREKKVGVVEVIAAKLDDALKRLAAGENAYEIAKSYGLTLHVFRKEIEKATGKTVRQLKGKRTHQLIRSEKARQAIELVEHGNSISDAAAVVGVSRQYVFQVLQTHGISAPRTERVQQVVTKEGK